MLRDRSTGAGHSNAQRLDARMTNDRIQADAAVRHRPFREIHQRNKNSSHERTQEPIQTPNQKRLQPFLHLTGVAYQCNDNARGGDDEGHESGGLRTILVRRTPCDICSVAFTAREAGMRSLIAPGSAKVRH